MASIVVQSGTAYFPLQASHPLIWPGGEPGTHRPAGSGVYESHHWAVRAVIDGAGNPLRDVFPGWIRDEVESPAIPFPVTSSGLAFGLG